MHKPALIFVFFLISVLGASGHALAANESQASAPLAKFAGQTVTNPNRTDKTPDAGTSRSATLNTQAVSYGPDFSMYAVWFDFKGDDDGDGYYHKFDVNFDVDTRFSSADIYVTGQLDNGIQLFRTVPYTIYGATGADSYRVTVLLTDGYPSGQYGMTLKVYDAHTDALLLTYGPQQDDRMGQLYLEDVNHEAVAANTLELFRFDYTLSGDTNGDGYYTQADVTLDVDAPNQTRTLYASLYLIDNNGNWIPVQDSPDFTVSGYSSQDTISVAFSLDSGFSPQNYRFGVEIYDAQSNNLMLTSVTPDNAPVKMESSDYDQNYYGGSDSQVSVHYHSAGSLPLPFLGGIVLLLLARRIKPQH